MKKPVKPDVSTEQAILEAAERLFLEKGLALTSTVEIAKMAGCNQALVHYYYRSKDKLFEAIFLKKASLFMASLVQIDKEQGSFEEKLRRKIEAHFEMIKANPRLPILLFNELTTNPRRILSIKRQLNELPATVLGMVKSELDAAIKKGRVRPMTIVDIVLLLISLNVIPFVAQPILKTLGVMSDAEYEKFLERKKKENVDIILKAIKP
jgi:TetR/AcrR family transcriptional regulator